MLAGFELIAPPRGEFRENMASTHSDSVMIEFILQD